MENEVLKAIKERRSIRRFKSDQITDEELKTVLEAGTWAATGHGTQEPFIIAVQNPEICAQLRKMNAEIMGVESDPYYGAPTIVIVLAPESNVNGVKDGSLILGNMMLAAHSIGLASCWINREDGMFASEEGKKLMKDWNLPEGFIIAKTICTNFQNEMCIFPIFSRFVFQLGISFKRLLIGV